MPLYLGTDNAGTQQYSLQDFEPSFGSKLNAAVRESWLESYGPVASDFFASRGDDGSPKLSADEAKSVLDESGLKGLKITARDGQYTRGQLDVLLDRQRSLQAAKDVRDRTPWDAGSIVRGGAMFAAGIVDPINLATAFVPWTKSVGALRGAAAAATTGETLLARSAGRAAIGAVDAGISTAVLEPFNYYARNEIGDDYGAFDAMANIAFGTAFGGGLHVLGGAAGDALRRFRTGDVLTPEARARVDAARALPVEERAAVAEGLTPAEREALNIPTEAERAGMPEVTRAADAAAGEAPAPARPRTMSARIVERNEGAYLMAENEAGSVGGVVEDGALRINFAEVAEGMRGQGHGVALYERLVNEAIDRGLRVTSDETLTNEAARVYAALERRGFTVTRTEGVGELAADADYPTGALYGRDEGPVFIVERGPDYQPPVATAADTVATVEPETREALLRAAVAQSVDGREVDVDAIAGLDPSRNTATPRDAAAAADRNLQPEAQPLADFDASAEVQARNDAAPKWSTLADAEAQAAEVDAILADTVRAGDDAFKYAREQAAARTETDAFKAWFGDSKVSEGGKPRVVYHGTARDFTEFALGKGGKGGRADTAGVIFFTDSPAQAQFFARMEARRSGEGERLMPVYLSIQNPKVVDWRGKEKDGERSAKIIAEARAAGHDGVIYENVRDAMDTAAGTVYAVFDPAQAKSSIGNRGTFDPANPDVRYALSSDRPLYEQGIPDGDAPAIIEQVVRKSFGDASAAMLDAGRIKVVATVDDLPGGPHPGDVQAATAPDGTVWVVANNVNPGEVRGLVLHEIGVHVGMERMLGADIYASVLRELDDAVARGEDWAQMARSAVPEETPAGLVREEQLAYLVQNSPDLPLVKRIIAAIKAWAYRNFEFARNHITLSEADFQALAVSALRYVAQDGEMGAGPLRYAGKKPTIAKGATDIVEGKRLAADQFGTFGEFGYDGQSLLQNGQRIGDLKLRVDGNRLVIDNISTLSKGQGIGTAALRAIIEAAQAQGLIPTLTTEAGLGKAHQKRLRAYYERLGFVKNSGAAKMRGIDEEYYLPPAGTGEMRYSRGETPEPTQPADELAVYDERISRAKQYPAVLRAAADKLESDAAAAQAMKAALPDITTEEIAELLAQLRKQVQGLRRVTRSVREAMAAEDTASELQPDAMRAADTLANNIEMAAVIEKRNAALNMNARLKATAFLNQFRGSKLDFEGFRALLVGTERKRTGGRLSVDAEQKGYRGAWLGGLIADMTKAGQMENFASGAFDRDVFIAMYRIGKGQDTAGLPPEAVQMAEIVNKYQEDARNTRNRFGAWIRDLSGYITRQTHDMFKIRDAGEKKFKETVLPLLDLQKTMGDFQGSVDDFLTRVYDDFAAGSHMKAKAGEDDMAAFGASSSLAKRESASRVLYFKDGEAAYQYNQQFGQGKLAETVLQGLDSAAKSAGLLKVLGTNPEATLTRLFDEYMDSLRGDPERRQKFNEKRGELATLLKHVDGSANIPGSAQIAKLASAVRSWVSMAKLGGMLISSITDLSNYAAELRFGQGRNLLGGTLEGIGSVVSGRAKGEKQAVLNALGVFHESTLGAVFARFDSPDLIGGKMAAAMQQFFKLSGINWWTESLRDGYALTHANYLASNTKHAWDKLPDALRDMLGLYNIDAGKWEILRTAKLQGADGRSYMTPEGLKTVPRSVLEAYITSVGRTVSDTSIANLQADLSQALRTMTIDRMHHAVIEPGARTRAFMLRGTQPGTATGELWRFVTQFKSFPIALIQMTLGREIYGRGYDTLGDYIKRGKGDMLGLASFIALSTAMGYAAMSIKDLIRGKNPRPVDDWRTWQAAMVQGGGLGIYGDFLFGKYNRMGGSLSGSLMGPVAGLADTAADLWTRIRNGDDAAAATFNAALQNTPFMNLFYTRSAMDYLFLYSVQEALNPGWMRRSEQRIQREQGQTYYLPPSQNALRPAG